MTRNNKTITIMSTSFKDWVEESMPAEEFMMLPMPLKQSLRRSYEGMNIDIEMEVNNCTYKSRYRTLSGVLQKWKIKRTGAL